MSVSDVVDAILLAMKSDNKISSSLSPAARVFNVASGKSISINDLAKPMIRIRRAGLDLQPLYEEERKGDIKNAVADMTRAKNILGFTAKEELETGLKQLTLPRIC